MKIYLARHGQNEDNAEGILNGHRDRPLTELGIHQAYELAEGIENLGLAFDAVYCSPLVRARETAEVACEKLGLPAPTVLKSIIERDFGVMTGKPICDIKKLCAPDILETEIITYFLNIEGVESWPAVLSRAESALEEIRSRHTKEDTILLVSHGDIGKMLYGAFYKIPWLEMLSKFHFGNCELVQLVEGSDPQAPHVVRIEQHNH